jgi:transmembrane sensor
MTESGNNQQRQSSQREAIEATAGVWLSLRDRGMTPTETEAFVRWLQEDPEHASTFASLERAWREFDQLSTLIRPGAPPNANTLTPRYRRRVAKLPVLSLATAAALVIGIFGFWIARTPSHFAETVVGAFQKVDLPDGSVALLNTNSAIDAEMHGKERRVNIVKGEVHFSVHKDPSRPFIVSAGGIQVRAVGTAFDVRSRLSTTEVIVTEGRVQLRNAETGESLLAAGTGAEQQAALSVGEKAVIPVELGSARAGMFQITRLSQDEVQRALAWQERRLEFDDVPLAEVVAEFNRYNQAKLVVADARLAKRPFSGMFRADGYEAFVLLLQENFGVMASRERDEIHLTLK